MSTRDWKLLAREGAAPPDVHGYIPDLVCAEQAAARLAELDAWRQARVIKANPDRAQLPVRIRALREGKLAYLAVPRLASVKPFYLLDPANLGVEFEDAATSAGAADAAPLAGTDEMRLADRDDLVQVCPATDRNHPKPPRQLHDDEHPEHRRPLPSEPMMAAPAPGRRRLTAIGHHGSASCRRPPRHRPGRSPPLPQHARDSGALRPGGRRPGQVNSYCDRAGLCPAVTIR
jgi:hypothetical protein